MTFALTITIYPMDNASSVKIWDVKNVNKIRKFAVNLFQNFKLFYIYKYGILISELIQLETASFIIIIMIIIIFDI